MKKRIRLTKKEMKDVDDGKWITAIKSVKDRCNLMLYDARKVIINYGDYNYKSTTLRL